VEDKAFRDGGGLLGWTLSFTAQPETVASNFTVDVQFLGGLRPSQEDVFMQAARRWQEIILGDGDGNALTVIITAEGVPIDEGGTPGEGNVLGQARPTHVFTTSGLIARGLMEFDEFDLDRMESDGSLLNVIIHEMGHVLGHGTLWRNRGLLVGAGTFNPRFVGVRAMQEFGQLQGANRPIPVPVANTGGAGTQDSHWRESTFGNELLTGRINGGINPISRMSIASVGDLGYSVNVDAAEPYELPSPQLLAQLGTEGSGSCCCSCPHHVQTGRLQAVEHSH
jgi:hypothetical protein